MSSQGNISLDLDRHTRAEPCYFLGLLVAALGLQRRQLWQVVRATRPSMTGEIKEWCLYFKEYFSCDRPETGRGESCIRPAGFQSMIRRGRRPLPSFRVERFPVGNA